MSVILFIIAAFLIFTGMDMTVNYSREKGTIFPWTKPIHDFIVKIFDQHIF